MDRCKPSQGEGSELLAHTHYKYPMEGWDHQGLTQRSGNCGTFALRTCDCVRVWSREHIATISFITAPLLRRPPRIVSTQTNQQNKQGQWKQSGRAVGGSRRSEPYFLTNGMWYGGKITEGRRGRLGWRAAEMRDWNRSCSTWAAGAQEYRNSLSRQRTHQGTAKPQNDVSPIGYAPLCGSRIS